MLLSSRSRLESRWRRRTPLLTAQAARLALSPPSITVQRAQISLFGLAMATARYIKEDIADLFRHLI